MVRVPFETRCHMFVGSLMLSYRFEGREEAKAFQLMTDIGMLHRNSLFSQMILSMG